MNVNIINFTQPQTGNFFADLILWLVGLTSSVAFGVILFTLLLKLITLPFDFMSRFSMRKNSIKMEEMRPELEKLQQQYAGNKELYNQKMMALYKKNGYSMFGACLPTIITLVIFIIAINGFNAYSHYQNKQYFYEMSVAYNNAVYAGMEVDGEYIAAGENGKLIFNDSALMEFNGEIDVEGKDFKIIVDNTNEDYFTVTTTNGYIVYKNSYVKDELGNYKLEDGKKVPSNTGYTYSVNYNNLENAVIKSELNNNLINSDGKTFSEAFAAAKAVNDALTEEQYAATFIKDIAELKSAETFRNSGAKFLWVKNIWVTDSPMKHPVETDWNTFKTTYGYNTASDIDIGASNYASLIAKLGDEQTAPNGYFILVALTALSSLLTQLIIGKSQKAQMELQTVDGQGAQTQKIMMWMMPIMMAVFAFMYTAAFSIYIVISSVFSLLTTILINKIADAKYKNKNTDDGKVYGRIHEREEDVKTKTDSKAKTKKGKDAIPDNDFLSGLADKKHHRGRIKK